MRTAASIEPNSEETHQEDVSPRARDRSEEANAFALDLRGDIDQEGANKGVTG
jgi:hypothetical protein